MIYQKIKVAVIVAIIGLAYYQIDYKRHFVCNFDGSKVITIWERIGNNCYIIPGKYLNIFPPKENYIKTVNHRNYIGLVWNPEDNYDYKISIYNSFKEINLTTNIKTYTKNDSLLLEYNVLDSLNVSRGIRYVSDSSEYYRCKYDINYVDLNRVYGIKIYPSGKETRK
jgi:hypothetical protein